MEQSAQTADWVGRNWQATGLDSQVVPNDLGGGNGQSGYLGRFGRVKKQEKTIGLVSFLEKFECQVRLIGLVDANASLCLMFETSQSALILTAQHFP